MEYLHNPTMYWVFAQFIRLMLLPIVLPVRLYEYFKEEIGDMEPWEAKTFIAMVIFIFLAFLIV